MVGKFYRNINVNNTAVILVLVGSVAVTQLLLILSIVSLD